MLAHVSVEELDAHAQTPCSDAGWVMSNIPHSRWPALARTALRLGIVALFAVLVNLGLNWLLALLGSSQSPGMQLAMTGVVVLSLCIYAILMAIPFVPGLEIGLSLLMMQGIKIVPFVAAATFGGLMIAYLAGRYMPYKVLHAAFDDIGLKSASRLLDRLKPLEREARLDLLRNNLPKWLGGPLVRYRYVTLALALNVPGNVLIGGGGGIALIAGFSRTFSTKAALLTFAIAVSPVPVLVYVFGVDVLGWIS